MQVQHQLASLAANICFADGLDSLHQKECFIIRCWSTKSTAWRSRVKKNIFNWPLFYFLTDFPEGMFHLFIIYVSHVHLGKNVVKGTRR